MRSKKKVSEITEDDVNDGQEYMLAAINDCNIAEAAMKKWSDRRNSRSYTKKCLNDPDMKLLFSKVLQTSVIARCIVEFNIFVTKSQSFSDLASLASFVQH